MLAIRDLAAGITGRRILNGINLEVGSGEVHAVMGPNGSGKSTLAHVVMGRPGYEVLGGSVTIDGVELLGEPTWRRAQAGLFLALQYPIEVPGVSLEEAMEEAVAAGGGERRSVPAAVTREATRIGLDERILARALNVDLSGGEKKRNETLQLGVLRPKFALLDEIDSGLDVDALRAVARRVEEATEEFGLGVLAITHYSRLLRELRPDVIHVLSQGRIVDSGGPEMAEELERTGYAAYGTTDGQEPSPGPAPAEADPFADPLA
ncbi:MAG TPA: Fe-S cluster assembly ATPase SufC [Acidimicrobiales bacterium]|nr:Fe-S cluster assembly ATPase SufC [Acidimicrobiales bacterium]